MSADYKFEDFYSYTVGGRCIYRPRRVFCTNEAVDRCLPRQPLLDSRGAPVKNTKGKIVSIAVSQALAAQRNVSAVTWTPAEPELVLDRLAVDTGWLPQPGAKTYNFYLPPNDMAGDAAQATRWVEHWRTLYPGEADHIISWLAHRVQFPGIKPNHCLVLVGDPGIGKDTLLHPVTHAVGTWNFRDINLNQLVGAYNDFLKAVLLRINEARDAGDTRHGRIDRYALHDHMKPLLTTPPETYRINRKYDPEYPGFNVVGVLITTNHGDALYLPADDRRHYVAASECKRTDFPKAFFDDLYHWYDNGGIGHVAAYLREYPLAQSGFDAKATPPRTTAFWEMVQIDRSGPEEAELADAIDRLRKNAQGAPDPDGALPEALTVTDLVAVAPGADWLLDRKMSRAIPHRLQRCGYRRTPNPDAKGSSGMWVVDGKRVMIYTRDDLGPQARLHAAQVRRGAQLTVVRRCRECFDRRQLDVVERDHEHPPKRNRRGIIAHDQTDNARRPRLSR
jgi:hypothetical protein